MRFVLMLALLCVGFVYASQRTGGLEAGPGAIRSALPAGATTGLPPEMRRLVGAFGIGGGARGGFGLAEQAGPRPFADRGPRRAVARVKRDLRRVLRRLPPRGSRRVRVAAFQGVAVVGDRALVVVDFRRSVRASPGAVWRHMPIERRQVALRREGRTWRLAE